MSSTSKYRVRIKDKYNWVIEAYDPGGKPITKGRYAGETTVPGWKIQGHFRRCDEHLCDYLLDLCLRDKCSDGALSATEISAAYKAATREIRQILVDFKPEKDTETLCSPNPAADFTKEQKDTVLNAKDPVAAYLKIVGGKRFKRTGDEMAKGISPKEAALERCKD